MKTTQPQKTDLVALLSNGQPVIFKVQGFSMYPFLYPLRDEVVVHPLNDHTIRKGDVCLYRRMDGILILHRVLKVTNSGIYTIGDHEINPDGPLPFDRFYGIMTAYRKKGKQIKVTSLSYRMKAFLWLCVRKQRLFLLRNLKRVCVLLHLPNSIP